MQFNYSQKHHKPLNKVCYPSPSTLSMTVIGQAVLEQDSRKSTSGFMTTLFNCPIRWRTQSSIATSSTEAELYAIGSSVA
eukprot:2001534-Amphidinium_carterae.1